MPEFTPSASDEQRFQTRVQLARRHGMSARALTSHLEQAGWYSERVPTRIGYAYAVQGRAWVRRAWRVEWRWDTDAVDQLLTQRGVVPPDDYARAARVRSRREAARRLRRISQRLWRLLEPTLPAHIAHRLEYHNTAIQHEMDYRYTMMTAPEVIPELVRRDFRPYAAAARRFLAAGDARRVVVGRWVEVTTRIASWVAERFGAAAIRTE